MAAPHVIREVVAAKDLIDEMRELYSDLKNSKLKPEDACKSVSQGFCTFLKNAQHVTFPEFLVGATDVFSSPSRSAATS